MSVEWSVLFILPIAINSPIKGCLEKANMMMLMKEATDKDRSLKTQLVVSTAGNNNDKISGEQGWRKDDFFQDIRPDLKLV